MKEEMKAREKRLNAILKNHGICVEWIESVKNNQTLDGYVIKKEGESLSPILYYTPTWYEKTDFEVVEFLISFCNKEIEFDMQKYFNRSYVLSHVKPMIIGSDNQSKIEQTNLIYYEKEDFVILCYIEVDVNGDEGTIKITDFLCEYIGVTKEELIKHAFMNLENDVHIMNMNEILKKLGVEAALDKPMEVSSEIYVVTNKKIDKGAVSILLKSVYEEIAAILGPKFIVLPSSIHECLVVAYNQEENLSTFTEMVKSVNITHVQPDEKLADQAYLYDGDHFSAII